jgi:hypothetical protein
MDDIENIDLSGNINNLGRCFTDLSDCIKIVDKKLEPIEVVLSDYFKDIKRNLIPESKYKYIILSIHIIHFTWVILVFLFGLFFPPKLQIYLAIYYFLIIVSWFIFGKCFLIILTNVIGNTDIDFLFPLKFKTFYIFTFCLIITSLLFYIFPKISFFNILQIINKYIC